MIAILHNIYTNSSCNRKPIIVSIFLKSLLLLLVIILGTIVNFFKCKTQINLIIVSNKVVTNKPNHFVSHLCQSFHL